MINTTIKQHYQKEQIARTYDRERFSSVTGWTFNKLELRALRDVLEKVRRAIPQPRVLDIPCGTGRITELWLGEGLEVLGGDISEAMLAIAREKCGGFDHTLGFRQLDLDHVDMPDGSFELVTCIRLFHHLETGERAAILRELARVSARFVLINVSYSSRIYRLRRRLKRTLRQGVSRTSSTWDEIQNEARNARLRILKTRMVLPLLSEDMIVLLEKTP